VSQPSSSVPPYRVSYSEQCRDQLRQLLARAVSAGRFAEVAQAVRSIDRRLQWIPLDFGEPLKDFKRLGIKAYIGVVAPLVIHYGVDEARRIVYVSRPLSFSRILSMTRPCFLAAHRLCFSPF
jgi:hypothetical protein